MATEVRRDGGGVCDDVIKYVVIVLEVVVHVQHLRRQTPHRLPVIELYIYIYETENCCIPKVSTLFFEVSKELVRVDCPNSAVFRFMASTTKR